MTASTSPSMASGPTIIEEIGRRVFLSPAVQPRFLLRTTLTPVQRCTGVFFVGQP